MSKKARKGAPARSKPQTRRAAAHQAGLHEAAQLLRRRRPQEALAVLQQLEQSYPNDEDLLVLLVNTCFELNDLLGYQDYVERLLRLRPDDPDLLLALASVYAANMHPSLAVPTFRRFLERYPSHPNAGDARERLAELETMLDTLLPGMGLTGPDRLELAALHDRVGIALNSGDFAQGRRVAQQLLSRLPTFIPAHNNLSLMDFAEGKLQSAVERAHHVLTLEPDNYQALGNLAHYLALMGQEEEARRYLQALLAIDKDELELHWKQAETLAYLGEDEALLDVYQRAEARGYFKLPRVNPILHHLAAVAALRLGHEQQARDLWRQALKLNRNFALASNNLADLEKPVGQRHAPWPFPLQQWLPRQTLDDALKRWQRARNNRKESANRQVTLDLLKQHPELVTLAGILLDRGDPAGREFALELALLAQTPALLQALLAFALGQRGPDEMRLRAARAASMAGLLPDGPVRTWVQGKWQDIIHYQFDITWEPANPLAPATAELLNAATRALYENQPDEAEHLLLQALALAPETPEILNNLAVTYEAQGRDDEALALIRRIHEENPDYFFGNITMANVATNRGAFDEALNRLQSLTGRRTLHISEFENLCMSYIQLGLAKKDRVLVEAWLKTWETVDADSETFRHWQTRARLELLMMGH